MDSNGISRIMRRVRALDAFPKTMEDARIKTASGGILSLLSLTVIVILFISEFIAFLSPERHVELRVDVSRGESLKVYIDIDFPRINCELLGIDALDATGNIQLEITNGLTKTRLDKFGKVVPTRKVFPAERKKPIRSLSNEPSACGSCYGATDGCCNTCSDVQDAYRTRGWVLTSLESIEQCVKEGKHMNITSTYRPGEGCKIDGFIQVSKVQGNFHISPGHTFESHGRQMHDMSAFRESQLDLSHTIHSLSFGDAYPGQLNPLDGVEKVAGNGPEGLGMYEYFVKVVPTSFKGRFNSHVIKSNQYSVTEFFRASDPVKGGNLLPGVFIIYDMSPILLVFTERQKSFFHFIVQFFAIIGGVYSISCIIDSGIYHLPRMIKKKNAPKLF
uniref:Endoplasmic reticulum vesicle transporter C-terminal domain-containing protein n=2 Tax=Timspurckia oligopyrenoides TaxID=708627 RepID=A0A7S1EQP9_9RHOD|mmetsp:Transcript_13450/g.24120  ORF Transcript_13450/g.24120 Transcript_13450/m.24120 type:complete len:389 (+) Transcript_13450:40-1206(+)